MTVGQCTEADQSYRSPLIVLVTVSLLVSLLRDASHKLLKVINVGLFILFHPAETAPGFPARGVIKPEDNTSTLSFIDLSPVIRPVSLHHSVSQ